MPKTRQKVEASPGGATAAPGVLAVMPRGAYIPVHENAIFAGR